MKLAVLLILIGLSFTLSAQNVETDSLKKAIGNNPNDTARVYLLEALSYAYLSSYPDTSLQYAIDGLALSKKIQFERGEAICTNAMGNVYFNTGDNAKALEMFLEYLRMKERLKDFRNISVAYYNISGAYVEEKDYSHALFYLFKAYQADLKIKDSSAILYDLYSLGSDYLRMGKIDSAIIFMNQCYDMVQQLHDRNMIGAVLNSFGEIYLASDETDKASDYYRQSLPYAYEVKDLEVVTSDYYGLSKIANMRRQTDSAIYYSRKAYGIARAAPFYKQSLEISNFLSDMFKLKKRFDSAFFYKQASVAIRDSLFNEEQTRKVQNLKVTELQRQQSIETARIKFRATIKLFIVIAIVVILIMILLLLWRSNKLKQQANRLLNSQKEKLESTLSELRATQSQLIQSEKMASLGQLTAGIAHEIQNPLNFVNNFSDVNKELITEMNEELERGEIAEARVIAENISQNLEKIYHHGKRADSIVKGMLQHSRVDTAEKEPAELNNLVDEYLRLCYHGLRAKDTNFHCKIKTSYDPSIDKINLVPQDIGRVVLNIIANAFYAVNNKKNSTDLSSGKQWQPTIAVSTKKIDRWIEISISDNGEGVPPELVNKIFHPFFTTKPTGQGTGLGLSLSYEIISAAGGDIRVEAANREQDEDEYRLNGATFVISLPIR